MENKQTKCIKQKFCASSWLITEINILRCMVRKTLKKKNYNLLYTILPLMKKSEISPDMLDKIGIEKNSMKLHEVHLLFIVISCGLF